MIRLANRQSLPLILIALLLFACGTSAQVESQATSPTPSHIPLPACLDSNTLPRCYSPQQIRAAYAIQPLLNAGIIGKGQTIVLIVHNPQANVQDELHLYDRLFGLNDPQFRLLEPFGPVPPSHSVEATLDVEVAHAIAPGAALDLVAVDTSATTTAANYLATFLQATKYAIDHHLGDVISQSFAAAESCLSATELQQEHHIFQEARDQHITVLAATGDTGAGMICSPNAPLVRGVAYPASDPLVTAVGGTTLEATKQTGAYLREAAWTEASVPAGGKGTAGGGGFSAAFARPAYQQGIAGIDNFRGIPDVAFDADFATGVPIVVMNGAADVVMASGGTSAACPQWAGIAALADQFAGRSLGFLNAALYRIAMSTAAHTAFHDILTGNNTYTYMTATGTSVTIPGYAAGSGWDAASGLGTPQVATLVPLLARATQPEDGSSL